MRPSTNGPTTIAASAVGCDQQRAGVGIAFAAHLLPPPADGLHGELRGVMIDAHAHPALVATHVEHAVGDDLAQLGVREVVNVHSFGLAFALPLSPVVLVRTTSSFFFVSTEITGCHAAGIA